MTLGFDVIITEYSTGRIRFTVKPQTVRDNDVSVKLQQTNPANSAKILELYWQKMKKTSKKIFYLKFHEIYQPILNNQIHGHNGN